MANSHHNKALDKLSIAYAMPVITTTWLISPIAVIQGIYAKYYGISLVTLATIALATRLIDAITDPITGYYADRYYQRTGTRKPFIIVGAFFFIFSGFFLYSPPIQAGPMYFAFWFTFFMVSWTLFEIPHLTWGGELTPTSQEKTRIYSYRAIAQQSGMLLFYTIPFLPFFATTEITPETLTVSIAIAGSLTLILTLICLKTVPDRLATTNSLYQPSGHNQTVGQSQLIHQIYKNRPFWLFIVAAFISFFSLGMWYSLIFIYVDAYLRMSEEFANMFIIGFLAGLIGTPFWYKLSIWLGKKTSWSIATSLIIAVTIYTGTLKPGATTFIDLVALSIFQGLAAACWGVVIPSMLSEIADYGLWKYRTDNTATYFSIYAFTNKAGMAIANAVGLGIAGWFGFNVSATFHSEDSIFGLRLAISWVPVVFSIASLILITLLPINTRRHAIIRRRIDLRANRIKKEPSTFQMA